jgi:polyisoprenyl-teichoic acid--peptidoglycan teichoic acid transferase
MSKKVGFLVLMVTVFGVLITAIVIVTWWNRPLGEPLLIPSPTLEPAPSKVQKGLEPDLPAITQTVEKPPIRAMTPTATATITPETTEPTIDEPQPMYILAAGIDSRQPGYQGGLADVIRIVRIDFDTPRVTVLTLPRDLWVELPGIKEAYPNLTHGKLNTAYSYGTPAMDRYQGEGGGPGLLAHTIAHNYGLVVDHYAVINMEVFVDIVDALGGIDLYLDRTWDGRADTDDPDLEDWVFEEGEHHMEGDEALRFARIRLNDTEIIRTDNQTAVICAIKDKMLHPSVFGALPNLVKAFLGRIQTDLTPAQISQLIALLPKLRRENLLFIRFPNPMLVPGRAFDPSLNNTTFVWDIPIEDVRSFVQAFMGDTIPVDIGGGGGRFCP